MDEVGSPKYLPKLMGAPHSDINNNTFLEHLWGKTPAPEGKLQGQLLGPWEISEDGTQLILKLRKGIPFHHGYGELTAEDILWTMENSVEEGTVYSRAAAIRSNFFAEGGGTTIVDDHTLSVDTVVPRPDFTWFITNASFSSMGHGIYSKKYYEELGTEEATFTQAVGTGPWRSVERQTGGTWRFEAVRDHWRKTPNFAGLDYIEIAEESTRLANFQTSQLDSASFKLESIREPWGRGLTNGRCGAALWMPPPALSI